ncbi:MAG: IS110 family transposase [Martelella sp.]|jgi:transposase|uniref:IS110 family transposase n=1 Tax=Martelella sp. TaxID=1969699 RepID=UPI000C394FF9|nr:IS110 family transposase [Martelella sp.]MAU22698.1 IS110 family transposase [Martelella sp.]|tara:strand:- start:296 stop:1234 length:939 start_codon:yes stop_codon:yes gene_type:complete
MDILHTAPHRCFGIDVAKDNLVVSDGGACVTIPNNRRGIRAFLKERQPDFIICEPTGGYELILLEECLGAGLACHRADVMKLKAYIRSMGTLGKSDAIDARHMAIYGRERWASLPLWREPDPDEARLQAFVRRRADLVALKVAEQNRSKAGGAKALAASFKAMLGVIQRQIDGLEKQIAALVENSARLRRRIDICMTVSGVGFLSAASLLAQIPELGSMDRRQAAALAGTAPHPSESGNANGRRRQRGGRPQVKTTLFMPAMCAAQGKGQFAPFYKRLIQNGKPPIVAVAATMRKIIITINARIRDHQEQQS